ncbi:hypothetical protein B0H17DRAFT_1053985 [Mycena rosella]|uniref:Uncharacterized protein n=1 Tax=Mycena rosella TaxID=1033263 RepID=A0AAD7DPM1_MYCRO|nr:hypothetical protein B0H17DRAFT_1053985 [Mycena rosella]
MLRATPKRAGANPSSPALWKRPGSRDLPRCHLGATARPPLPPARGHDGGDLPRSPAGQASAVETAT